jgi:uncharacterized RDD family membrane protein YckC
VRHLVRCRLWGGLGATYIVVAMKSGKLHPSTLACPVGTEEWRKLTEWPDFRAVVGAVPPPLPSQDVAPPTILYAGFWDRARAAFLDGIIWIIAALIGGRVWAVVAGETDLSGSTRGLLDFMVGWVYFAAFESSGYQATLGKKALGLKVTDLRGARISFGRATVRYLGRYLSTFLFLGGFIMAAFTERTQTLHDILASCLVVYREPPSGLRAFQRDLPGGEPVRPRNPNR